MGLGIAGVEIIHFGVRGEYFFDKIFHVCVADEPGMSHHLAGGVADKGQREAFFVGLYLRREPVDIGIRLDGFGGDEYRPGLVKGIGDGEGGIIVKLRMTLFLYKVMATSPAQKPGSCAI